MRLDMLMAAIGAHPHEVIGAIDAVGPDVPARWATGQPVAHCPNGVRDASHDFAHSHR
jgi:hypothetical protein